MKTIYLIRHAQASEAKGGIPDYKRPLTKQGVDSLRKVSEQLKANSVYFDIIITSHAVRAFDTARLLALHTAFAEHKIKVEKRIYNAINSTYFDLIFEQNNEVNDLVIVGHNPQITGFANYFLTKKIEYLPPAGMVGLQFQTEKWTDICHAKCDILILFQPDLK